MDISTTTANRRGYVSAQQQRQQQWQQYYLISYNLVSAILWTAVLGRVLLLIPLVGFQHVYGGVGDFTKWTQTLAVAEVVHSALGLIRSPLPTTTMQVLSRLTLVWGILDPFPTPGAATRPSAFYSTMLLAWSVTEVIRYAYFVFNLQTNNKNNNYNNNNSNSNRRSGSGGGGGGGVPAWLIWLRYNTFYILYPLGVTSEWILVLKASLAAGQEAGRVKAATAAAVAIGKGDEISWVWWWWWVVVQWVLRGVLVVYVPGFYVLFTHMVRQRRKVMRGKGVERR